MSQSTTWMFHYVRPSNQGAQPFLKAFSLKDFREFLDTLVSRGKVIDPQDYLNALEGQRSLAPDTHLLTFDDGLSDHYQWVFPELQKRSLRALFFVTSGPLAQERLLKVHKTHALYGAKGYSWLKEQFLRLAHPDGRVPMGIYTNAKSAAAYPYDDAPTAGFKYALNYLIPAAEAEMILDRVLADSFDENALAREFYLSREQIKEMSDAGMQFGYHGHTHLPFSRLNSAELEKEMDHSERLLGALLPSPPICLSYPFGDTSAVSEDNVLYLRKRGIRAAFLAEHTQILGDPLRLPRTDCAEWFRCRHLGCDEAKSGPADRL